MSFRYFLQEKVKDDAPKLSAKEAFRAFVYDSKYLLYVDSFYSRLGE